MKRSALCILFFFGLTTIMLAQAKTKYGQKLAAAPAKVRAIENPYANSEAARAAGRKLFERHCAGCHGRSGEGGDKAPSLQAVSNQATPGMLHWFIKNGNLREGMPSWSRLPDQQLWQIVAYLEALPK